MPIAALAFQSCGSPCVRIKCVCLGEALTEALTFTLNGSHVIVESERDDGVVVIRRVAWRNDFWEITWIVLQADLDSDHDKSKENRGDNLSNLKYVEGSRKCEASVSVNGQPNAGI